MRSSEEPDIEQLQSNSTQERLVGALTALPALIEKFGADPASVCSIADVDLTIFDYATNFVRYGDLASVLDEASKLTACPHFGLFVGEVWSVADLGLIGELMRNSPTLGAALRELELYHYLNSQGAVCYLLQHEKYIDVGFAVYVPLKPRMHHVYNAVMAAGFNFIRELSGLKNPVSDVFFTNNRPNDVDPYRHMFHANVHFNSLNCALRIPKDILKTPIKDAKPERLELYRKQIRALGEANVVEQASRSLRALLLVGNASAEAVAQSLGMHRRTLNRRLAKEGTAFHEILDNVRFAIASELLRDSNAKIPTIAEATAYSDPPSFVRAFKRWSGLSPGEWRKRNQTK
jgi:AraC-like DNA-binding protein